MTDRDQLRKADSLARARVQTCFDRPVVLAAGAGTGKTAALVARVVAWSLGPGWERSLARGAATEAEQTAIDVLSRIVAITFTEAAASEMSARILEAFSQIAADEMPVGLLAEVLPADPNERRLRCIALVDAFDHLTVRTIHAFCRRLLSRYPLEAGLHPAFEVDADEQAQGEVVREVVEAALRVGYRNGTDSALLELATQGFGPQAVEEALAEVVRSGMAPAELARDPLAPARVVAHFEALQEGARALCAVAEPLASVGGNTSLAWEAIRASVAQVDGAAPSGVEELSRLCDSLRAAWDDKAQKRLVDWSRARFNGRETKALDGAQEAVARSASAFLPVQRSFVQLQPRRLQLACQALAPLLERVSDELRSRGIASYASLLSEARRLLERRADVCAQVRRGLDQLLVDEFQDTDSVQCQLVRLLALRGPVDERPGLFLVGDPKQSIYGWRNADLRSYDEFVEEVVEQGGELHSLCVNFRSVPAILDEVERVIEPVMWRQHGLQPSFQPLLPCERLELESGFAAGDAAPVEYWVSWRSEADGGPAPRTRADEATEIEARALARDLRALHDEHDVAWRDAAILMRGAGDLDDYLAALREQDVPYVVERDRSYYRRREVIEAVAWIRCVLDPSDHLALLSVLRSSSVGVPDVALIPLWARSFPKLASDLGGKATALPELRKVAEDVASSLPDAVPGLSRIEGWPNNLAAALEVLTALREGFEREPADVFVEQLRVLVMLEPTEAARHLGAYRAANLERLFRELADALATGGDVQAVLRRLRLDVEGARDAEEERPKVAVEDAVQVMTIHKAKGLDFEHVYLVQLHKRAGGFGAPGAEIAGSGENLEFRLFGVATLGMEVLRHEQAAVEAAERVRTLYVAMTRAKRRLVLMGLLPLQPKMPAPDAARSHVELLGSRRDLPTGLPAEMKRLAAEGHSRHTDVGDARWVFPAIRQSRVGAQRSLFDFAAAHERQPAFAEAKEVAWQAEQLAELQAAAESRMLRPRGGAASAHSHVLLREEQAERRYRGDSEGGAQTGPDRAGASPDARGVAMAAGSAIHRVLEDLVLTGRSGVEAAREVGRLGEQLPVFLESLAPPSLRDAAAERASELLARFADGPLLDRLCELADHVVARELPIWLPASAATDGDAAAPVDFVAGAIDLVYRDPADGGYVVVDYKTDDVSQVAAEDRAQVYASQGLVYARALQLGLALTSPPRIELWFIASGEVVEVAASA